jgi:ssDNA-binding Zn-finger/Zn-ribbon topoisomerase 1
MFTKIICPVCGGEKRTKRNDNGGKRTNYEPCSGCNGKDYVCIGDLKRICAEYLDQICELECELRKLKNAK